MILKESLPCVSPPNNSTQRRALRAAADAEAVRLQKVSWDHLAVFSIWPET
jgi:hypothetical protein